VDEAMAGRRLDQVLSQQFSQFSRSYLARAIEKGLSGSMA
jgi:23S rRNA-/tRNA-specific pseudouridylate synthase